MYISFNELLLLFSFLDFIRKQNSFIVDNQWRLKLKGCIYENKRHFWLIFILFLLLIEYLIFKNKIIISFIYNSSFFSFKFSDLESNSKKKKRQNLLYQSLEKKISSLKLMQIRFAIYLPFFSYE